MCLTYCHQRNILFDSDTDDVCGVCKLNRRAEQSCENCRHEQGEACALTRAALPSRRWCCHCNADTQHGWRAFSIENVRGSLRRQPFAATLDIYGAEYEAIGGVLYRVNLDSLAVPLVYGVPVEHWMPALAPVSQDQADRPVEWDWSRLL
jgi:hypothetical protein